MAKTHDTRHHVKVKTRIYPLRVIYSSASLFLDKAYLFLDGDPDKEIIVTIRAKNGSDSAAIAEEFQNELLNASLRQHISRENKKLREFIVGSALLSVSEARPGVADDCGCRRDPGSKSSHSALNLKSLRRSTDDTHAVREEDAVADPLGIRSTWEEKYGKGHPGKV